MSITRPEKRIHILRQSLKYIGADVRSFGNMDIHIVFRLSGSVFGGSVIARWHSQQGLSRF